MDYHMNWYINYDTLSVHLESSIEEDLGNITTHETNDVLEKVFMLSDYKNIHMPQSLHLKPYTYIYITL